jgi:hypothetical protein
LRDSKTRAAANWIGGNEDTENTILRKWRNRWKTAIAASERGVLTAHKKPDLANHKIYKNLYKHEALILMQARTGCVGITEFLFRRHMPNVPTPLYSCGKASETPEHMLLYCQKTRERKGEIRDLIASKALRTRRNLAHLILKHPEFVADWLLRTGKFILYNKARRLQKKWKNEPLESNKRAAAKKIK